MVRYGASGGGRGLDGTIIFISTVSPQQSTSIPKDIVEQEDIRVGYVLNISVYPLFLFEFDSSKRQDVEVKVGSQFKIPMRNIDRATTINGNRIITDKVLVSIRSITIPSRV